VGGPMPTHHWGNAMARDFHFWVLTGCIAVSYNSNLLLLAKATFSE
jgi:hypothetical protein